MTDSVKTDVLEAMCERMPSRLQPHQLPQKIRLSEVETVPETSKVPRPFNLHWGSGQIVEEARFSGEYHVPAVQLLEFTDGEAAGTVTVRFCYFSHEGRFQRSPMMLNEAEFAGLREALNTTPRLKALLTQLVG